MKFLKFTIFVATFLSTSTSFAELSISEIHRQDLAKIERPAYCKVREDIARNILPTTPNNMSFPEFGQQLIGWGTGAEGALAKLNNVHLSDIDTYKNKGLTPLILKEWQAFYENETKRNSCNPTAPIRAQLMQKILQLWS